MLSITGKKALKILIEKAKEGRTVGYRELASLIDSKYDVNDPHQWLYSVLGNVSKYTYQELGIMISILVVNKDGHPGPGFKELAGVLIADDKDSLSSTFVNTHLKTLLAIDHNKLDRLLVI
ncbi:MAG: hypothetical protein PHY47_00690 [Lachnospiraceae bacterium]|nr:hypothetical protein [Lachnospiraceae bacterium]